MEPKKLQPDWELLFHNVILDNSHFDMDSVKNMRLVSRKIKEGMYQHINTLKIRHTFFNSPSRYKNLTTLKVTDCTIKPDEAQELCRLRRLKSITWVDNERFNKKNKLAHHVHLIPNLNDMSISGISLCDFKHIVKSTSLTSLSFTMNQGTGKLLKHAHKLCNLKSIELENDTTRPVCDKLLVKISKCSNVEELAFLSFPDADWSKKLSSLSRLPKLTNLRLSGVESSRLDEINTLTNLTSLFLEPFDSDFSFEVLTIPNLKSLTIHCYEPCPSFEFEFIEALTQLTDLYIEHSFENVCFFSPHIVSTLTNLQSLSCNFGYELDIDPERSHIIHHVSTLIQLTQLDLECPLYNVDCSGIGSLIKLKRLKLVDKHYGKDGNDNDNVWEMALSMTYGDLRDAGYHTATNLMYVADNFDTSFLRKLVDLEELHLDISWECYPYLCELKMNVLAIVNNLKNITKVTLINVHFSINEHLKLLVDLYLKKLQHIHINFNTGLKINGNEELKNYIVILQ